MPIGHPFTQLAEVDSTNNYATRMVQAQLAEHGATWFAHHQTNGRGQRAKSWLSMPGENIILSCVIAPTPLQYKQQFNLSAATALACVDFFNEFTNGNTAIKWPNDLYWRDRKAGGILIENIMRGKQWSYAIVGIGVNINQVNFPSNLPNPVSLRQITGKQHDPVALAKLLCQHLEQRWQQLQAADFDALFSAYNQVLYKMNQVVRFAMDNAIVSAKVCGVAPTGELLLNTGQLCSFSYQDIKWLG